MICIDAEQLQDGLYNIKDGKIYKYKAKGGTVRTYDIRNIIRCGECKYWKSTVQMPNGTEVKCLYGRKPDDFCSYGEREGE